MAPHDLIRVLAAVAILATAISLASAGASSARKGSEACAGTADAIPNQISAAQAREAILCLVNAERKSHGLKPLKTNKRLQKAATSHNRRMLGTGCFAHECGSEPDLETRLENVGYLTRGLSAYAFGENIGWGSGIKGDAKTVMASWMNSSLHRGNVLERRFREIGIAFAVGTPSSASANGSVYTAVFGLRSG